jgi:hypothetical protein
VSSHSLAHRRTSLNLPTTTLYSRPPHDTIRDRSALTDTDPATVLSHCVAQGCTARHFPYQNRPVVAPRNDTFPVLREKSRRITFHPVLTASRPEPNSSQRPTWAFYRQSRPIRRTAHPSTVPLATQIHRVLAVVCQRLYHWPRPKCGW